jgi:hypothetical protein
MPSTARATFEANRQDVDRLMQLHTTEGGDEPGRRVGLEVLNKSAIVLLCAVWEAYVEDLATEVIDHYVTHVGEVSKLPKRLPEQVHKELTDQSSTASWKLAGDGWRAHLRNRLNAFEAQRNTGLNTPKASYVQHFFATAVGVTDVPAHWSWSGMAADKAQAKLDRLVTLRGDIAHRGSTSAGGVRKGTVTDPRSFIRRLVEATDGYVCREVDRATGVPLFT